MTTSRINIKNTTLYWRCDSRGPDKILSNGFTPRSVTQNWLSSFIDYHEVNINSNPDYCVSMSTYYRSTFIFPCDSDVTNIYLYAIAAPAFVKLEFDANIPDELNTKNLDEIDDLVVDLHNLQASIVAKNMELNQKLFELNPCLALCFAWPLYAYEATTQRVKPEQIVAVIKLQRIAFEGFKFPLQNIFKNQITAVAKVLRVSDLIFNELANEEYKLVHLNELNGVIQEMPLGKEIASPNPFFGLCGMRFSSPEFNENTYFVKNPELILDNIRFFTHKKIVKKITEEQNENQRIENDSYSCVIM